MDAETYWTMSNYLSHGKYPEHFNEIKKRTLRKKIDKFEYHNGQLYFVDIDKDSQEKSIRPVLMKEGVGKALEEFHINEKGQHLGRDKMLKVLSATYYWRGMRDDIQRYLQRCNECKWNANQTIRANLSKRLRLERESSQRLFEDTPQVPLGISPHFEQLHTWSRYNNVQDLLQNNTNATDEAEEQMMPNETLVHSVAQSEIPAPPFVIKQELEESTSSSAYSPQSATLGQDHLQIDQQTYSDRSRLQSNINESITLTKARSYLNHHDNSSYLNHHDNGSTSNSAAQACATTTTRTAPTIKQNQNAASVWQRVSLHLIGPLIHKGYPLSGRGYKYLLTIMDQSTKWPHTFPLYNKCSDEIAERLFDSICQYGCMTEVLSEFGRDFDGKIIGKLMTEYNVMQIKMRDYRATENAVDYKWHQTLLDLVEQHGENWDKNLSGAMMTYRTTVHESTKHTPFFLMYGRETQQIHSMKDDDEIL